MWGWVALGAGALGYYKRASIEKFVKTILSPHYSPPPIGPGGYVAPPAPAGVPPSWTYQGPPIPAADSTGNQTAVTVAPGNMHAAPASGDTFAVHLPAGAQWYGGDPDMVPTSIGGTVTSDFSAGPSAPLVIAGIAGAGTMQLNWRDASGGVRQTMLDVSAK